MNGIRPSEGSTRTTEREDSQELLRRRVTAVVVQYSRRWIRAREVRTLVTSRRIYDGFRRTGQLTAIIKASRCALYRLGDVLACMLLHQSCLSPDDSARGKFEGCEDPAARINALVDELLREKITPWVRATAVPALFTSRALYLRCRRAGWLIPRIEAHRCVIYSFEDVLACWHRVEREGAPPNRGRKPSNTSLK